jgi:hypothetical protein
MNGVQGTLQVRLQCSTDSRVGTTPVRRWVVYVHEVTEVGSLPHTHASCSQGNMVYSGTSTNFGLTLRLG